MTTPHPHRYRISYSNTRGSIGTIALALASPIRSLEDEERVRDEINRNGCSAEIILSWSRYEDPS